MMAAILNSAMLDSDTAILDSNTLLSSLRLTQNHSSSTLTLTQTNSIWLTRWWQPSWILPSWIQSCCTKLWLKLVQSDRNSFILTQLDDSSHPELCHVGLRHCHFGFRHLVIFSQINSKTLSLHLTLTQTNSIWLTRWWQPSWILPSWIQSCCTKVWLNLIQSDSNSFILTQIDDGSHHEFCHVGFRHFHLGLKHLVIFSQFHSKTLSLHSDSDSN